MSQQMLFQMWEPFRQSLIESHLFYIEEAKKRLLSQFDDIESEADIASEVWLKDNAKYFNPDVHDSGEFEEKAYDAGIQFYQLLSDMRDTTRLSVVAGMYHEWDKNLRQWIVGEIRHWHVGRNVYTGVWKQDIARLFDLLESLGWKIRDKDYFSMLDACRLVVNVYKHGNGNSLSDLKAKYPEYLANRIDNIIGRSLDLEFLDHTHLFVNDSNLQCFSHAIVDFWRDVPDNIFKLNDVSLPDWFKYAVREDRKAT